MIHTALVLKEPLAYIRRNTKNKEYKKIFLSSAEWTTLKELERIFVVLVKPTTRLQSEYYININKSLLFVYSIYSKFEDLIIEFQEQVVEEPDLVSYYLLFLYLNIYYILTSYYY